MPQDLGQLFFIYALFILEKKLKNNYKVFFEAKIALHLHQKEYETAIIKAYRLHVYERYHIGNEKLKPRYDIRKSVLKIKFSLRSMKKRG